MEKIIVDEVDVFLTRPKNGQVAWASCVYNKQLSLNNLAVHARLNSDRFRIVYPCHILPTGRQINDVFPISREAGLAIEDAINNKMEEVILKKESTKCQAN